MNRMLKALVFSSLMLFGLSTLAKDCCDPCCDPCCNTSCCDPCCNNDCCCDCCCDPCDCCDCICGCGSPCMEIRSQSWNTARDLVGWQAYINQFEMEDMYGAFYITPEYTRSFKPCRIAGYLIGKDYQGGRLNISGSQVAGRGSCDWLADYFGLPTDYKSCVTFCPRVQNFLVDLGFYLGLDNVTEGMYFRMHAPIVYTKWELCVGENKTATGVNDYAMGYMSSKTISRDKLATCFANSMINGCFTWGDMTEALKWTKIDASCCDRTKTRLSDIQAALGWNFLLDEDYHMGLQILAGFPTGGKRCCDYMFSPIVGNGGHFELGGGLTSSARLWTSDDEESSCWVYLDANIAHLFKRKLYRTFELKNKPNSRYMLVAEMKTPSETLFAGGEEGADLREASTYQYAGKLLPLANITTCCTDVSYAVQGEATVKFAWNNNNWSFDLGYNIWGRTGAKVCGTCAITKNKYVLKGDAFVYGFRPSDAAEPNTAVALAPSQSGATIYTGLNTNGADFEATDVLNKKVDNPQLAFWATDGSVATNQLKWTEGVPAAQPADETQQNTSVDPKFLSCDDLNTCEGPSALSHKVFAHIGYAWKDDMEEEGRTPFLGLGGEAEFSGKTSGIYAALSQWGIWLKGGVAFN